MTEADIDRNREHRAAAALENRRQTTESLRNVRLGLKMFALAPALADLNVALGAMQKLASEVANPRKREAFRAQGAAMHDATTPVSEGEALVRLPKSAATAEINNLLVTSGLQRDFRGREAAEYRGRAPNAALRTLVETLGGQIVPLQAFPPEAQTGRDECVSPAPSGNADNAALLVTQPSTEDAAARTPCDLVVDPQRLTDIAAESGGPSNAVAELDAGQSASTDACVAATPPTEAPVVNDAARPAPATQGAARDPTKQPFDEADGAPQRQAETSAQRTFGAADVARTVGITPPNAGDTAASTSTALGRQAYPSRKFGRQVMYGAPLPTPPTPEIAPPTTARHAPAQLEPAASG